MGCSCRNKRQQYEVVSTGGKVLFTSASKSTAEAVSRRYEGSTVQEKGTAATVTATGSR